MALVRTESMSTRRGVLCGLGAASALGMALPAVPAAAQAGSAGDLLFQVLRFGDPVGHDVVSFTPRDDGLHVAVEMEAKVKFGFITLFHYLHRSTEVWREGRLVSLVSDTYDNGKRYKVNVAPGEGGLVIDGPKGRFLVPAETLPTSYWHPDTIHQTKLIDAGKGRVFEVVVAAGEMETVEAAGRAVEARRYVVTGNLNMTLWYTDDGHWVRTAFTMKGSDIELELKGEPSYALTKLMSAAQAS